MSDFHGFNIDLAEKYGVDVAVFIKNLKFWIEKNIANEKHFHDGRYWTYNSYDALAKLFPYWSKDQLKRIVKKAKEMNLICTGNYNKSSYDKTNWYSFTDYGIEEVGIPECSNESQYDQSCLGS